MTMLRDDPKAKDVMVGEPVCVETSTTVRQLARVFEEHGISGAPVVDREGRLVGIVSKTDLIRRCSEGTEEVPPAYLFEVLCERAAEEEEVIPERLVCVQDFMTADPVTVAPETPAAEVAQAMFERRIHRVVVVDRERPVGIITSLDLLGALSRPAEPEARAGARPQRPISRGDALLEGDLD